MFVLFLVVLEHVSLYTFAEGFSAYKHLQRAFLPIYTVTHLMALSTVLFVQLGYGGEPNEKTQFSHEPQVNSIAYIISTASGALVVVVV